MSQIIPIYIPTFISDQNYNPARVLPHVYFYNGNVECESFFVADQNDTNREVTRFPYFDNYSVVSGSFPSLGSKSLLFQNENSVYGSTPTSSLYTEYWEKYIQLLYNPKTRLLNCSAIIPLADYVKMELNDVVNFRGNYYHLRAINEYSLKTGECQLQLLGPIIPDTISDLQPEPPTPDAEVLIHLEEFNSASIFVDANLIVSGTAYYFSGNFSQSVSGGAVANVVMEGKDAGSTTWGSYKTGSATLSIFDNGTPVTSSTQYIYSGSGDTIITIPTTFTAGHTITISGSTSIITEPPPAVITFTVDNPGVFPYPVTAGNGSASGTIKNNTGSTIYVYGWFNSGGQTSGTNVSLDGGSVDSTNFSFTGTISGSGQNIYSTNYHTLTSDNTEYNWTLSKQDTYSTANLKLGYATTPGGSITQLNP